MFLEIKDSCKNFLLLALNMSLCQELVYLGKNCLVCYPTFLTSDIERHNMSKIGSDQTTVLGVGKEQSGVCYDQLQLLGVVMQTK